jgi:hypothetical protein
MEITDDPLTLDTINAYVNMATETGGDPARQQVLHFALRNCIRSGNIVCMKSILRTYLDIDLNRSYDKGGLLFYASSLTLLMQGRKNLSHLDGC